MSVSVCVAAKCGTYVGEVRDVDEPHVPKVAGEAVGRDVDEHSVPCDDADLETVSIRGALVNFFRVHTVPMMAKYSSARISFSRTAFV